jgi:hypothetical protein
VSFIKLSAQNNITSSAYSLFGIGDPLSLNNTMGLSMGDVKYAMDRPFYLNYANPASYASLKAATFSLGAMLNRTRTFNDETSQDNDNGTLRYFGLGIPITKKLGISIGARPFTSLGYGIQVDAVDVTQTGDYYTRYEGEGGLSIAYGGIGYEIITDSIHTLSLGVNANFYFGNKRQTAFNNVELTPGALNALFQSSSVTSDFGFDAGLIYRINLSRMFNATESFEHSLTFGGTYSIPTDLKTRFESFSGAFYYNSSRAFVITDTLSYSLDTTSIFLPQRYGVGINYELYNRHTKNMWIIEADYEYNGWSDLKINQQNAGLQNSSRYSIGMQFIPDATGIRDFFKLMRYRAGFNYRDSRIQIGGERVVDMSGSFGIGIPLVKSKSIYPAASSIDLGVVVGNRGTVDNGLIREQYTNIYIGLSFAPNFWDRWFKKRKIN